MNFKAIVAHTFAEPTPCQWSLVKLILQNVTDLEQAVELLGVDEKFLSPFDSEDLFNEGMRL